MNETINSMLKGVKAKEEQRIKQQFNDDEDLQKSVEAKYDYKEDKLQWIRLSTHHDPLKVKLKKLVIKYMNQYKDSDFIDRNQIIQKIPDKVEFKWTREEEISFLSKRLELFNERTKWNQRGNINNFAFFENVHLMLQQDYQQDYREDLVKKFFQPGQYVTEDQVKYLVQTSQLHQSSLSKNYMQTIFKTLNQENLEYIESLLAEQIIQSYQQLLAILKQKRKQFISDHVDLTKLILKKRQIAKDQNTERQAKTSIKRKMDGLMRNICQFNHLVKSQSQRKMPHLKKDLNNNSLVDFNNQIKQQNKAKLVGLAQVHPPSRLRSISEYYLRQEDDETKQRNKVIRKTLNFS